MISLLRYLTTQGCSNPVLTAPLVRDILEQFREKVEFDGLAISSINTQLAVIRAFHFIDPLWGKSLFLKCLAEYSGSFPQGVLAEVLSVLETLLPLQPEERKLLFQHLKVNYVEDPSTFALYRSILLQDSISNSVGLGEVLPYNMDIAPFLAELPPAAEPTIRLHEPASTPITTDTITICQISDIHFGKFHSFNAEEHGPPGLFTGATQDLPVFLRHRLKIDPDFYVICGDLASSAADDFRAFHKFAESLPIRVGSIYDRLLIVPGNHDIFWTPDGNDKLDSFRVNISSQYLTPFGRVLPTSKCYFAEFDSCPVSVYVFEDERAIFLLLTSSLYSGEYEKKILEFLNNLGKGPLDLESEMRDRIRFENGYLHFGYVNTIEAVLSKCSNTLGDEIYNSYFKLAVIHHNFDPVFDNDTTITGGADLRRLLKNKGFSAVVHGHTHKVRHFPGTQHAVQTFSVQTFSGKHSPEKNGLNIIKYDRRTSSIIEVLNYEMFDGRFNETPTGHIRFQP